MKWNSVAVPLISAAASAAKPLGKSLELGAGSAELGVKREESERAPEGNRNQATGDRRE
jgi:hypothetical protein